MSAESPQAVCDVLTQISQGTLASADQLLPLVYGELRGIAHSHRRRARGVDTLRTTALVHEAYLKLVGSESPGWKGRAHFLAVAAKAMRQILSNYARDQRAAKRGGDLRRVTLNETPDQSADDRQVDLVALDGALDELAELDARQARIVELRYLSGMTVQETAAVLDTSESTVERDWRVARAWLSQQIARNRES